MKEEHNPKINSYETSSAFNEMQDINLKIKNIFNFLSP